MAFTATPFLTICLAALIASSAAVQQASLTGRQHHSQDGQLLPPPNLSHFRDDGHESHIGAARQSPVDTETFAEWLHRHHHGHDRAPVDDYLAKENHAHHFRLGTAHITITDEDLRLGLFAGGVIVLACLLVARARRHYAIAAIADNDDCKTILSKAPPTVGATQAMVSV